MSDSHLHPERAANLAENPYAGQGPVMLDIGDDVGAIVLHLPASLEGAEVEIAATEGPDGTHGHTHPRDHSHGHDHGPHRPHVAVVGRPVDDHVDYSAVFPALVSGPYLLYVPGAPEAVHVEVQGGAVTEATWPDGRPAV